MNKTINMMMIHQYDIYNMRREYEQQRILKHHLIHYDHITTKLSQLLF